MEDNWYTRSLNNIADSIGQAKISRTSSIKKAMLESFDLKISNEDSKKIKNMLNNNLNKSEKESLIKEKISEMIDVDDDQLAKIASYLSNFKC